jgi:hypothetical protein
MAINLNDNLSTLAPKPTDNRYGPYGSLEEALLAVSPIFRYPGLTVGIQTVSQEDVTDYWFNPGVSDSDLVKKVYGPSSIPGDIGVACSDETTPLEPGLKLTLHAPFSMDVYDVKLGCNLPPSSIFPLSVDVKANGESIFYREPDPFPKAPIEEFGQTPYIAVGERTGGDQAYFIWNQIKEGTELTYYIMDETSEGPEIALLDRSEDFRNDLNFSRNSPPEVKNSSSLNSLEGDPEAPYGTGLKVWLLANKIEIPCDIPPYSCNTDVDPSCATNLSFAWANCEDISEFPLLDVGNCTKFIATWENCESLASSPEAEEIPGGPSYMVSFFAEDTCESTLTVEIVPDLYPNEVSWKVMKVEEEGNIEIISSGVGFSDVALYDCGDYLFEILDSADDGGGPYTLKLNGQVIHTSTGSYGSGETISFTVTLSPSPLGPEISEQYGVSVLPFEISSTDLVDQEYTNYSFNIESETKRTLEAFVDRGEEGRITAVTLISPQLTEQLLDPEEEKEVYEIGDQIIVLGSLVGGQDVVDDLTITFIPGSLGIVPTRYSFPTLDTSKGVDFTRAWSSCRGLRFFPPLDLSKGTNFYGSWFRCENLVSFPSLDTSSGVNFAYAWENCSSLTSFPLLDTSSGVNFSYAWKNCYDLTSFPSLNSSAGTNFSHAWYGCSSLTSFPPLDASSGTNFSSTWFNCSSLTSFPLLDTSSGTNFRTTWTFCSNLTTFPSGMFDNCRATDFFLAWQNCALSQQSVDNILVSLDTGGQNNGVVHLNLGTSSPPGSAGVLARSNLVSKGWSVFTNS